jgi:hypothetical protein
MVNGTRILHSQLRGIGNRLPTYMALLTELRGAAPSNKRVTEQPLAVEAFFKVELHLAKERKFGGDGLLVVLALGESRKGVHPWHRSFARQGQQILRRIRGQIV